MDNSLKDNINVNESSEQVSNVTPKVAKATPFISREWYKGLGGKTMGNLTKLSKSFLLPIALLPIAGLFLGIGASISGQISDTTSAGYYVANLFSQMGSTVFGNLPILFCVSAVIAYTGDSGSAVLAGIIAFLVFNALQAALITTDQSHFQYTINYTFTDMSDPLHPHSYTGVVINDDIGNPFISSTDKLVDLIKNKMHQDNISNVVLTNATSIADNYKLLFWTKSAAALYQENVGILSLNTGVFAGIIVGCSVAFIYNRTYKVQLPSIVNFFSGIKFVPIVVFFAIIPLSFLFMFIWPPIGSALSWFGNNSGKLPYGTDSLIFEIFERSLVPFGLHHVYYAPLWWTSAGGGPLSKYLSELGNVGVQTSQLNPGTLSAVGDQYLGFAILGDNNINFKQVLDGAGINIGRFMTGKFPFMMFGLPAAAVAMWLTVPKENRRAVLGIYFSAAATSFLTGITEPIEYTFLFVAPWLFWGVHMPIAATSFWIMGAWHTHVLNSVSGGFMDLIMFGILPADKLTNWWHIVVVGPGYSAIYFFVFYFLVRWRDIKIPGRDGAVSTTTALYTKADYKAKKHGQVNKGVLKALIVIEALGGKDNIKNVDACASRLRVNLGTNKVVDKKMIMDQGAFGVMFIGKTTIAAVFSGESDIIKTNIKDILSGKIKAELPDEYKRNKENPTGNGVTPNLSSAT